MVAVGSENERAKFSRITGIKLENENITARVLRKLVAKTAGLSETNVARLKHINSSLQPELKEVLEEGKIGISAADELASTTSGSNLGLLTRKPKSLSHREYIYYQVFHLLADAPNCC